MDAVIAIEQVASACPRSADVVQAGSFGPIRIFAEYASPALKAKYLPALLEGRAVISARHDRAGGRLGGDRSRDDRADRRRRGYRSTAPRSSPPSAPTPRCSWSMCGSAPGVRRHRLGAGRARRAGLPHRQAVALHERRGMVRALFRELPIPAENVLLGAGGFKKQIAGFNVERIGNAARALAFGRYAFDRRAITSRRGSSSAGRCASSRACSGSSPTWR